MVTDTSAITSDRSWRGPPSLGTRWYLLTGVFAVGIVLATAATAGAITLVEPGHSLNLIADSVAPVHLTQVMLGTYPSTGIESITVDDATGNIYVQVMGDGHLGCPSQTTAIYQITPAGVTTVINAATGFGICERASDIDIDPATGLLVAQNENAGANGEIATVTIPGGALGSWVIPSVFLGNTFGMQFAPGIGVVPAGDIVYVSDVGGDINSAPFGGPNVHRATPPDGGDDLYIQPDGDIVFFGDFNTGIHIYNPTTFASVPAALPDVQTIFTNAGLYFECGTRATMCPDGEGFLSFSCVRGGTGVFRLNEPLTTSTLVLTMAADEGIHDITVGPPTSAAAVGLSLFMTVENYTSGAHQVWEVTDMCGAAGVKWNQPPDPVEPDDIFYGWNEYSEWEYGPIVADDWYCETDDPVSDIHWWGSFLGWQEPYPPAGSLPNHFRIQFWTDVPTNGTGDPDFSHPGQVIHEVDCYNYDYQFVGWDYDPLTGLFESCFKFEQVFLPSEYFYQQPGPNIYWVSIAADYDGTMPQYPFGWKTRPRDPSSLAPDAAVIVLDPAQPVLGSMFVDGIPIVDWVQEGDQWDMAFDLTSESAYTLFKWEQPPDLTSNGIDVNATSNPPVPPNYILADDFQCTMSGPLTHIQVWGSWFDDYLPNGDPMNVTFTLSIHADIPADQSPTGYSMPGATLWERTFSPGVGNWFVDPWATGPEGWLDPPDAYTFPADWTTWRYFFIIDPSENPFYQEGSMEEPVTYWLNVQAMPHDSIARFGWKTAETHWNDDAVWGDGFEPYPGPWYELRYPPDHVWAGQSIDLAFEIWGDQLNYSKWYQPPVPYDGEFYNGWNEESVYGYQQIVADDWFCSNGLPVTDVHWWGSFIGWSEMEPPQMPDRFHIGFWTDGMCTEPGGDVFSCPVQLIHEIYCDNFTWDFVGWDIDPRLPVRQTTRLPEACFLFEQDLSEDEWFYQDASTNAVYWISIAAIYDTGIPSDYLWGWKTRPRFWNDDAVRIFDPTAPDLVGNFLFNAGAPIEYPDGVSWDMAFRLTTQEVQPKPDTFLIEFSVDIGSDTELSDPNRDGDEGFDPGDVYHWRSAPVVDPDNPGGRDGFKDDEFIFGPLGFGDVWPDPPDPLYATAVPVGDNVNYPPYVPNWFDLDGHDEIDFSLEEYDLPGQPRELTPNQLPPTQCIYEPKFLVISFEDDMAPGWPAGDVPVTAPSSAGIIYGTTAGMDEILEMVLDTSVFPHQILAGPYGVADEKSIHDSLRPNPDAGDQDDDDVDSLDIVCSTAQCPYWYFTADHEAPGPGIAAPGTLDPGDIYQVTPAGPVLVIDGQANLGLPQGTDVDAFEFAWVTSPVGGPRFLAVLFSVDEDDPLTPFPQVESGVLNPNMIYYSFLNGTSQELINVDLSDDVDGLTVWTRELPDINRPQIAGSWFSRKNHGALGDLDKEFDSSFTGDPHTVQLDGTMTVPVDGIGVETRKDSVTELVLNFSEPMDPLSITTAAIKVNGNNTGGYTPTSISLVAGVNGPDSELHMFFAAGQLPNGYALLTLPDRYVACISTTPTDVAGNPLDGDRDVEFIAQFGNVWPSGASKYKVNPKDRNELISHETGAAFANPLVAVNFDVWNTGPSNGKINPKDRNEVISTESPIVTVSTAVPGCP